MCQVLAETQQREEEEGDEEQKQMEAQRVQTSNSATDNRKAGKKKGEEKPLLCHLIIFVSAALCVDTNECVLFKVLQPLNRSPVLSLWWRRTLRRSRGKQRGRESNRSSQLH